MTGPSFSSAERKAAWEAAALSQLRDNLRLTPEERLKIAESLLLFAIQTPHYRPKPETA